MMKLHCRLVFVVGLFVLLAIPTYSQNIKSAAMTARVQRLAERYGWELIGVPPADFDFAAAERVLS